MFCEKGLPEACNFIKKETLAKVFSCEFCEISKNNFPYRTPLVAASVDSCHFSSLIFHDCSLKFSKQKVSYFEPFQSRPKQIYKDFELVLLRQICQRKDVLIYASKNGLDTK